MNLWDDPFFGSFFLNKEVEYVELVSKELNHLAAILHVYAVESYKQNFFFSFFLNMCNC